jgi:hypothetical protein
VIDCTTIAQWQSREEELSAVGVDLEALMERRHPLWRVVMYVDGGYAKVTPALMRMRLLGARIVDRLDGEQGAAVGDREADDLDSDGDGDGEGEGEETKSKSPFVTHVVVDPADPAGFEGIQVL